MQKIYFLSTCSTCQRIIKEVNAGSGFDMQDIKTEKITPAQLEEMAKLAGSYEKLFSRTAMKYKALGLKDKALGEKDYREFILGEYTFLKRPVAIIGNAIFIGNSPANVKALKSTIEELQK